MDTDRHVITIKLFWPSSRRTTTIWDVRAEVHYRHTISVAYTYKVRKVRTHPLSGKCIIFCTDFFPSPGNRHAESKRTTLSIHFRYVLAISLVRMRRNNVNSASGVKTALTIEFSRHDLNKGIKLWRFEQVMSDFWHIFTAHAHNGYLGTRSKIWSCHSLRDLDFHYRMTFTVYVWCSCSTFSQCLVTFDFDILTLTVFASYVQSMYQFFSILLLSVIELWITHF